MPRIGELTAPLRPYWQTLDESVRLYQGNAVEVLARLPSQSVHCVVTSPPYWGLRDYGVEGQLGSEPSPDCGTQGKAQCGKCFVCSMVAVFRGVHRVLRDDGVLWLNLGDSYSGGSGGNATNSDKQKSNEGTMIEPRKGYNGLPSGNLVGIPWRVALALQADGWILRQDIIWHKPSPMPESVRNRCTKAHEYVFLLTKSMRYFYDAKGVKEDAKYGRVETPNERPREGRKAQSSGMWRRAGNLVEGVDRDKGGEQSERIYDPSTGRNKRSVWTVASQGYPGAHFATFPTKLIEPMIKAGTSEKGCCSICGAPWTRVADSDTWKVGCQCRAEVKPCVVLDPFIGSGTTAEVSMILGRECWGIDLSEKYLKHNAISRIEGVLYRYRRTHLMPRKG